MQTELATISSAAKAWFRADEFPSPRFAVAAFLFSILAFAWSATSAQRKSSGVILFTLPASYAGKFVPESPSRCEREGLFIAGRLHDKLGISGPPPLGGLWRGTQVGGLGWSP